MSSSSVVKCLPSFCIWAPHFKPQENTHMNMHRGGSYQQSLTVLRWICPECGEDKKTVVDWKQYFLQCTQKTKEGKECSRMWFSSAIWPSLLKCSKPRKIFTVFPSSKKTLTTTPGYLLFTNKFQTAGWSCCPPGNEVQGVQINSQFHILNYGTA